MSKNKQTQEEKDLMLTSVCGLFCGACSMYIASTEDPARLKMHSEQFQLSEDELRCYGCRSDNRAKFCDDCEMFDCATQKGVDFCNECDEYPCETLKEFQAECPHRNEIWKDMDRRKKVGVSQWVQESRENYSCPKCNTLNSPYDMTCRKCGNEPGNAYVSTHRTAINKYLNGDGFNFDL